MWRSNRLGRDAWLDFPALVRVAMSVLMEHDVEVSGLLGLVRAGSGLARRPQPRGDSGRARGIQRACNGFPAILANTWMPGARSPA